MSWHFLAVFGALRKAGFVRDTAYSKQISFAVVEYQARAAGSLLNFDLICQSGIFNEMFEQLRFARLRLGRRANVFQGFLHGWKRTFHQTLVKLFQLHSFAKCEIESCFFALRHAVQCRCDKRIRGDVAGLLLCRRRQRIISFAKCRCPGKTALAGFEGQFALPRFNASICRSCQPRAVRAL